MYLQNTDFGFVHQVLSYERIHGKAMSAECRALNAYTPSLLCDLIEYGPTCLKAGELEKRLEDVLDDYYEFLGTSVFHGRDKAFWNYHKKRLDDSGHPFSGIRLAKAVCAKLLDLVFNPKRTAEKVLRPSAVDYGTAPIY
jgi:hypothetical protein